MYISEIPNINPIRETESTRDISRVKQSTAPNQTDNVSIGEESLMVARLSQDLKALQSEMSQSTADLKEQVESGNYDPPSETIARAILYGLTSEND